MTHQPRLALSIADKLDAFLAQATFRGLRIKALRLSPEEFRDLHSDPAAKAYGDGLYAGVPLQVATRHGASPWRKRSYFDGTERRFCNRQPISTREEQLMQRRAGDYEEIEERSARAFCAVTGATYGERKRLDLGSSIG